MNGTSTIPADKKPPSNVADPIIALRELGTGREWDLPLEKARFELGTSPECDITVDRPYLSSRHCVLERRGPSLDVIDKGSKNGIYLDKVRREQFEVGPGKVFEVAQTAILAITEPMRQARPTLELILGFSDHAAVDRAFIIGATSKATLLIGPNGSCHRDLAQAVHSVSPRRTRPQANLTDPGTITTGLGWTTGSFYFEPVLLSRLDKEAAANARRTIHNALASGHVAVFVGANDEKKAAKALGDLLHRRMQMIEVPPLTKRRNEITLVLNRLFTFAETDCRVAHLTPDNVTALRTYNWPENLEELNRAARRLAVIIPAQGINRTVAEALGESRSALQEWANRLRLKFPNQRD